MANNPLKDIRIATPCTASWEAMAGDERVRHCTLCSLNVYDFSELTGDEIRALIVRTEGRLCARMYRRPDGTLLTRDCPSGFQAVRQRMSRFAAAITAALFSVAAFASDGASCVRPRVKRNGSKVKFTTERFATAQPAALTGVVFFDDGTPIPGVTATLQGETARREVTAVTDVNGAFTFPSLNDGIYRLDLTLSGLTPAVVEHLLLKQGEITHARVSLRNDPAQMTMIGIVAVSDSTMTDSGVTTTFSQDLINKLPH